VGVNYLNQEKNIVIIGCGAGGGTTAQFARKTNRKTNITIFEKESYSQYSKCGLPYAISEIIPRLNDLIEFNEEWFKKQNIDLMLNTHVEKIDIKNKIVTGKKENSVIKKPYDSLIICTGSKPFIPPIKNTDAEGVCVLRTINDAKKIKSFIKKGKNAVIIGAGFIGLEMADNLHKIGMKTTLVELLPDILPTIIDNDMSEIIYRDITKKIKVLTNHLLTSVESKNNKIHKIIMKNKITDEEEKIPADLLIIATGTKPEVSLAEEIGCKIGETGGILVDEKCQTSIPNVYAVGDCTEYKDFILGKPIPVGLGSIAVRQGITAGVNAAGGNYKLLKGFLQTATSEFFDWEIASVGLPYKYLEDKNIITGKFNGSSLPEYFPGGKPITIKLLVNEQNGMILGAQAVGDNAAQRINTFAAAILGGLNVEKLRKLETAYAPPIAPTLDVVTLVCDVVSMKINRKKR
jgi:NADH oxidase (H2O2-forming)